MVRDFGSALSGKSQAALTDRKRKAPVPASKDKGCGRASVRYHAVPDTLSGAKSNSGNLSLSISRILVQFLITRDHALERKVFFDVLPDHVCFDVEIHGPLREL